MLNENFVLVGVVLQVLGSWGYLVDTLKGRVKPNKVSWFMWSVAPLIAFAAMLQQGVGIQSLVTFVAGFVPLIIFIASFFNKDATWEISKLDIACGALSLIGLGLWAITRVGNLAILFSISADGLAALPTIIKAYRYPETENAAIFIFGIIGSLITILTITHWNFETYGFPIYLLIAISIIVFSVKSRVGVETTVIK